MTNRASDLSPGSIVQQPVVEAPYDKYRVKRSKGGKWIKLKRILKNFLRNAFRRLSFYKNSFMPRPSAIASTGFNSPSKRLHPGGIGETGEWRYLYGGNAELVFDICLEAEQIRAAAREDDPFRLSSRTGTVLRRKTGPSSPHSV